MINRLYLILPFLLLSNSIQAKTLSCPDKVYAVELEEGHNEPYPDGIMPFTDHPPRWDLSGRDPKDVIITVHCYSMMDRHIKEDIVIPEGMNFCKLVKHRFTCSDHGQKYH